MQHAIPPAQAPAPAPAAGMPGWTARLAGVATVCCTGRAQGDMAEAGPAAARRRAAVVDRPWTLLRQVHGARVVHVRSPGEGDGTEADAAVTTSAAVALAVLTADCAPVAFASPEGVVGVAHAGWRGLLAGVVGATVDAMVGLGASRVQAMIGPCIEAACYQWSPADLDAAVAAWGPELASHTSTGEPAFDLRAGVTSALRRAGAEISEGPGTCTACSRSMWSWRARGDTARQATVAWRC